MVSLKICNAFIISSFYDVATRGIKLGKKLSCDYSAVALPVVVVTISLDSPHCTMIYSSSTDKQLYIHIDICFGPTIEYEAAPTV